MGSQTAHLEWEGKSGMQIQGSWAYSDNRGEPLIKDG